MECRTEAQDAGTLRVFSPHDGRRIVVTEELWRSHPAMARKRLLAHLNIFHAIYARNCEIRRISKPEAAEFLEANHIFGDAACKYRYGMFLKRHTGKHAAAVTERPEAGALVAVAEFSGARRWDKDGKIIRSHEWVRYASLPDVRVCGGMGRMLRHFIREVRPDDIMTYAVLDWSDGDVYRNLGFTEEGIKHFGDSSSIKFRLKLTDY